MDVIGRVQSVLSEERIKGRNGEFVRYGFVIETSGQYPKKLKFDVFGEDRWGRMSSAVCVGSDIQVYFDVSSREWQGRWFTQLDCYRVVGHGVQRESAVSSRGASPVTNAVPYEGSSVSGSADQSNDGLPF